MDTLWRLAWALPLVAAIGAATVLVLRRFLVPGNKAGRAAQPLNARASLELSDHTRVHLIEVEGRAYLLVESTQQVTLQPLTVQAGDVARPSRVLASAWMRVLHRAGPT